MTQQLSFLFASVSGALKRSVRPTSRVIPRSVYLDNHIAYGYFRRDGTKVGGVFGNPVLCLLNALVDASPIVTDRHGESSVLAASDLVADKSFDRTHEALHLGRTLLEQVD